MISLSDKTKISFFDYFYLFCIIVYAGSATIFARSMSTPFTIGNTVVLLLTLVFIGKNKIKFKQHFGIAIFLFTLYAVLTFIQNSQSSPMWLSIWYINLLITYVLSTHYGHKLLNVYETIIYHLCVISLILWGLYLIAPSAIESLVSIFQFSSSYSTDIQSKNMIVYTLLDSERQEINEFVMLPRNAGFAWEPGAFACFICLAIFCNIIRTNLRLKNNVQMWVLLAALLTTSSTTGYFILIAIFILWVLCNGKYGHMMYIIPIAIILFQQPFVKDKIMEEYSNIEYVNLAAYNDEDMHALGRMASFQLDWEEFLRHPILGLGGYSKGSWLEQQGYDNIATISGIGKLLSRYGIIMSIVFLSLLFQSVKRINNQFGVRNGWLMLVVIVGMMISYDLWTHPIFMAFWMYGFWNQPSNKLSTKRLS